MRNKYIGDKHFYKMILAISIPMIIQVIITQFVSLIDNVMIGSVGTNQMNGVSIVNQYIFIYNLTIFGAMAGPSIFGTQFFGKGDYKGQKSTFCFRIILAFIISALGIVLLLALKEPLINLFLMDKSNPEMCYETFVYANDYLNIIVYTLFPFALAQALVSVLRESNEAKVPMYGAMSAIGINIFFNYCLIFGKFGFPCLGVKGAAIATVMAKYVEAIFLVIYATRRTYRFPYFHKFYEGFKMSKTLVVDMLKQGTPLLINEFLWSMAVAIVAQCYSYKGLDVVAARNISSTLTNVYQTIYLQLGVTAGIIIGQVLGQSDFEKAQDYYYKIIAFTLFVGFIVMLCVIPIAYVFPEIYNCTKEIKELATFYLIVMALAIPIHCVANNCYFVLRAGGKTILTFLFDSGYSWFIQIPIAWYLCYKTQLSIRTIMIVVTYAEILKVFIGIKFIRSGTWLTNIVNDK